MSDSLQNEVEQKIQRKLDILSRWQHGVPWRRLANGDFMLDEKANPQLDYFPTSPSAFALWDGSQNSPFTRQGELASIQSFGRTTYEKLRYQKLKLMVDATTRLVEDRARRQLSKDREDAEIALLKDEIEYFKLLTKKNDQEIGNYETQISDLEIELRRTKTKLTETKIEARGRIETLEASVSKLNATIKKITRFNGHERKNDGEK
jgi:hypothetical protein